MRFLLYLILCLFWMKSGITQNNLVLNSGFETGKDYKSAGDGKVKYLVKNWFSSLDKQVPQYYHSPGKSVAKANSGSGAMGLILGGSKHEKVKEEYLTGELSTPLVKGQTYCVSFNMLLHRSSKWATSNVGVILHHKKELIKKSDDRKLIEASVYANDGEYVTNTKWQKFNAYFVASGREKYISFGRFGEGESIELKELELESHFQLDGFQSKAYYQVDDFSVVAKYDSIDCGCAIAPVEEQEEELVNKELKPFLFVLDVSGSMKDNSLFDSLRYSLVEQMDLLPNGTPVTFSTFSSHSKLLFTGYLNKNTPNKIDSLLSKVELGGGTNVFSGLYTASKSWDQEARDSARIILISDGAFNVTKKIETIVKNEYEQKGRQLTIVHIDSEANGTEKLAPYQTSFVHVMASELRSAIFQVSKPIDAGKNAIACECFNEYSDTMNYHFVIDYSGSMKSHKGRAIRALRHLYEKAPESAIVSITSFSDKSTELYVGRKYDMPMDQLDALLQAQIVNGGTQPSEGVNRGLDISKSMSDKRFSHLIIITDLQANKLNQMFEMNNNIQSMSEEIDLAVSSITVDLTSQTDLLVSGRTQFDNTTGIFRDVSRMKFEKDLFDTFRSSCDFTTQAYHYNPATDIAKKEAKKLLKELIKEIMKAQIESKL